MTPNKEGLQEETIESVKLELQKQLKSLKLGLPAGEKKNRRAQVQSQETVEQREATGTTAQSKEDTTELPRNC